MYFIHDAFFQLFSWDNNDAQVVCRQLGYSGGIAHKYAHFGEGSGQIWLDNVECGGYESMLTSCTANSFGDENCSHGEDAGVTCGMFYMSTTVLLLLLFNAQTNKL